MNEIYMYMAPEAPKVQSYLITLLDGTASMNKEYESIVQAHEDVFGYLGKDQLKYQWEGKMMQGKLQLFEFLPFRRGYKGNISGTFHTLFNILLDPINYFQKNITILFISDGEEPYDYDEISHQIRLIKEKYEIQFISVAVGDRFPNTISNNLRNNLHNQNTSCPPIFKVKRELNKTSLLYQDIKHEVDQEIKSDFVEIFDKINLLLTVSSKITVNVPVYEYLQSTEPTTIITSSEPFITKQRATIKTGNKIIKQTSNINTLLKLVNNSVHGLIIEMIAEQTLDAKQQFEVIEELTNKLLNQATESIESKEQQQMLSAQLELISSVTQGAVDLQILTQSDVTELQAASQPDKVYSALDSITNMIEPSPEQLMKNTKGKLTQIKAGCFIRSKTTKKQLDLAESIAHVIFQNLEQQKRAIENQPELNLNELCRNTIDLIKQELENIFKKQKIDISDNQLKVFRIINQILKILQRGAKPSQIGANQILNVFDQCLEYKIDPSKIDQDIFNQYDQLPQNLRKQIYSRMKVRQEMTFNEEKYNIIQTIGFCIFLVLDVFVPFNLNKNLGFH